MDTGDPLFQHTATAENGAGFRAEREGGFALLTPLTPAAKAWLTTNVAEEASWLPSGALAVEPRYFPALADAVIAAGFTFERDALPN